MRLIMISDEELFSRIRAIHDAIKLLRSERILYGFNIDKKLFRFNDIAEHVVTLVVARRYEQMCDDPNMKEEALLNGMREAIFCCIVGHACHIPGKGPTSLLS